jgi:agmatine deiminase
MKTVRPYAFPALLFVVILACSTGTTADIETLPQDNSDATEAPDSGDFLAESSDLSRGTDGGSSDAQSEVGDPDPLRIPGEWEPQVATWMQWPTEWEASLRPDFARIIAVVQQYQPVHLLVLDGDLEQDARARIAEFGGDPDGVDYHTVAYDNSWLRDNGPVYVMREGAVELQDWGFDGWGGNFGSDVTFKLDDVVPSYLADLLHLPYVDHNDYILERGNIEANGHGTLILGWDCQLDRNPGWDKDATVSLFAEHLGATKVIWVHGHDPADGTTGHIDGVIRFVDEDTVAVARSLIPDDPGAKELEEAAKTLAHAGFEVVRIDIPGTVKHRGEDLPAMYMNWLTGNGFVAGMAFGNAAWDAAAKESLTQLFPNRDIHLIDTMELWYNGGGIHCVTNDQPL